MDLFDFVALVCFVTWVYAGMAYVAERINQKWRT